MKKEKKQAIPIEPFKFGLISKAYNPWNLIPGFNKKGSISTNLILNDEIMNNILIKKTCNSKLKQKQQ